MSTNPHRHRYAAVMARALLALGVLPASLAAAQPASDAAYRAGTGLLNRGLHDLAAAEFFRFLKDNPSHEKAATAHYALGVCLAQLERRQDAAKELDHVVGLRGFEFAADALLLRGQCAQALGDEKGAAAWFERVTKEHAESRPAEEATMLLGESLYRIGELKSAHDALGRFVQRWPGSDSRARAELFLALCEAGQGEFDPAAARLKAMRAKFESGPYAAQATLIEAQCRQRTGQAAEAIALYQDVADSGDEALRPDALLGLGQLRRAAGDRQGAARALDQLIREHGSHGAASAARVERARVHLEDKQPREAMKLLTDHAAESLPETLRDDAAFWTARCESELGEHAGAVRRLSGAVATFPESPLLPEMRFDLAVEWLQSGDDARALEQYEAFRRDYPRHALAHEALGAIVSIQYKHGSYSKVVAACREYLKGAEASASTAAIELMLAESQYMLGEHADAEATYGEFIRRHGSDPQAAHARARRGLALVKLDRFTDAEPLLVEAVSAAPPVEPGVRRAAVGALADATFGESRWADAAKWLGLLVRDTPAGEQDVALLKLGLALQRLGKAPEAAAAYRQLVDQSPRSEHATQARFELGQVLYESGQLDEAKEAFERVLASTTGARDSVDGGGFGLHAARYLGAIATKQGRTADAAAFYEQAGALAGDSELAGDLLLEQGSASLSAGDFAKAEQAITAFIDARPAHVRVGEARGLRGIALARLGEHERALDDLDAALAGAGSLAPSLQESLAYERAWVLGALTRNDDAARAYAELLKQQPGPTIGAHASVELARLHVLGERYDEALAVLGPESGEVAGGGSVGDLGEQSSYLRGVCELRLQRFAPAAETLERFVKQYPASQSISSATLMLADALMKTGRPDDAAERVRRVVEASPSSEVLAPALLRLGEATAAAQKWAASEEAFSRFLSKFEGDKLAFQARFGIGWARENQGRHEAAMQAYAEVVRGHNGPTAARAQFQIGECLFAMKKHEEAARELLKTDILFAYPEWSAAALYEAGRCFAEMGKTTEARKQFEQVVQRFGDTKWAALSRERIEATAPQALPGRADRNRPR